jgi:hypothetical protein
VGIIVVGNQSEFAKWRICTGCVTSVISDVLLQPSFVKVVTGPQTSTYPDDKHLPGAERFSGRAGTWHEGHFNVTGHVPQSSGRGWGSEDRLVGALV